MQAYGSCSDLDELWRAGFSGHDVGDLEVELETDGFGQQQDGAARCAQVHVVQVDTHVCGHRAQEHGQKRSTVRWQENK